MNNIPKMISIRQVAATGILSESALRRLGRQGKLPAVYSGNRAYINFDKLCDMLNNLEITA